MSERFTRIYGDVEVVCIDNNKKDDSKFFDKEDYDKFVDALNDLEEENRKLRELLFDPHRITNEVVTDD